MDFKALHIREPLLEFANKQQLETPKDGLFLFGPVEDTGGRNQVRLGVIGTPTGIGLVRKWLERLGGRIPGKINKAGQPAIWAPGWPGFQTCFGIELPPISMAEIPLNSAHLEAAIKKENKSDAVRTSVLLVANAIREYVRTEDKQPDVWLVVVPDVVFKYGRPQSSLPPKSERTTSTLISASAAKHFLRDGDLFPETMSDADTYLFSNNFHHQLKAELLANKIVLQLILESTLVERDIGRARESRRGLQDEATVAWNFSTTLYFKLDAKPWALANVRSGVCYVGMVFKKDETGTRKGEVCCAAQMFLNSGDGLVFRGALGPWYSEKSREYHLSREAAKSLMNSVVAGYKLKHDTFPTQLFIHGRNRFSPEEWAGFSDAVPSDTKLSGILIKTSDEIRLFRPDSSTPVLRGTALCVSRHKGYLWSRGYVPRLAAYQGFETPKPLSIEITHGEAELEQVLADVLALTKVNYNACEFASGIPVTLKFANRVGEILIASPDTLNAPPLPFRFYI